MYADLEYFMADLRLTAAFMEELKESDPERHKRICVHWSGVLAGIKPNSRMGPPLSEFILDIVNDNSHGGEDEA